MKKWVDTLPVAGVLQAVHVEGVDQYLLGNQLFQKQGNTLKQVKNVKYQKLNVNNITFHNIDNRTYTQIGDALQQVSMMQVLTSREVSNALC